MARLLLDLSAWARSAHPAVQEKWTVLLEGEDLRCHPVFALELLHSATSPEHYQQLRNDLEDGLDWIWPDEETTQIAVRVQQRMATASPCGQRVKSADLLISALAVQHGLGVLHYDRDYDLIRDRGGESFASEWLAPRGSLEKADERIATSRKAYRKALGERLAQLQHDTDLQVWPALVSWMDEQLRLRGLALPPPPELPPERQPGLRPS